MAERGEGAGTADAIGIATLGGGCFWCTEATLGELRGVESVQPGYSGGHRPDPTYAQVCTGATGHAEVVQDRFDPGVISYPDLLRVFLASHDPTTPDRQGPDVGTQYRSVIFAHGAKQLAQARQVLAEVAAAGIWSRPIVTQVRPFEAFYPAEEYHRDYFRRNPGQAYCRAIIEPKVVKFRRQFASMLRTGSA